jgi:hypothetical protein
MGQEYFINSQQLESQVRKLLPSQGGIGAGINLSASTQIIPIVDLTESAEGSSLRQDLQRAISFSNVTSFNFQNTSGTILNTTGYWQIQGTVAGQSDVGSSTDTSLILTDGASSKVLFQTETITNPGSQFFGFFIHPFIIKLEAGDSLLGTADLYSRLSGSCNQIADVNGVLT